ncbi:uroporphyrinogen decarboxylase family protein [Thiorhodococcus minor]|uniref:Uroporphyrinogen decarboxylase n=1 Tax=Thiorhodococcus minor TaxID=57489 RepID=A0A6M0JT58_9GAMM|nr:uroporphyrinogen decarboxylase family protein [Thiorhodococcus minor]NEV60419.1 uroporphyrinogen decarboxylase [Thiorhodococcus minor]
MTGAERLRAAIAFESVDRVPVIAQVFGHASSLAGVALKDYLRDGELLARCQVAACRHYGLEAVFALMDAGVETEALGSRLRYRDSTYPTVEQYALDPHGEGIDQLPLDRACTAGRIPELLKATRRLRHDLGDAVLVIGCVTGPMTLAAQLMGLEAALYLAIDQASRFAELLDVTARFAQNCSRKQLEAGAHAVMLFDPVASPEVVPPQFYRELVLPRVREVLASQRQHGAAFTWIHVTGNTLPILRYYAQAGADLANIDFSTDLHQASQTLPRTCLNGNLKPLAFVNETPATIRAASERLLRDLGPRRGFILSPGCEIPLEARPETIAAMIAAARDSSNVH